MRLFAVLLLSGAIVVSFAGEAQSQESHGGVAFKIGTLGLGFDGAAAVAERVNVRASFNFFDFNHDFEDDGITLAAHLKMRSVTAQLDLFPFAGGFHVSPGVMIYNGNRVEADAFVPGGQRFTLGDDDLLSNPANPVNGLALVEYEKVAPLVTIGWGNVVPRGTRRWSIPVELGVAFTRAPAAVFSLGGSACLPNGTNCRNVATEPLLQADVREQEDQLNDDLEMLKIIPLFSVGFSYSF